MDLEFAWEIEVRNKLIIYGEELLAPRLTPKLEGHPLSADRRLEKTT
jgi:hypothetical protein